MFKSGLKIACRYLIRDLRFTILNLLGLSTGLACVILIYLWVSDERGMDRFHANNGRLYQVMSHIRLPDGIHTQENTPAPLARALATEMPEIKYAISVQPGQDAGPLSLGDKYLKVTPEFVDQDFFRVFSYRLLQGNREQPFPDKRGILLSDEMAKRLFQTTAGIIGKTIQWGDDKETYRVCGVFEKPGSNASTRFDILLDYALYYEKHIEDLKYWENSQPNTYLVLRDGADVHQLEKKISGFLQTKSSNSPLTLSLQSYGDRYLYGTYENGVQTGGRIQYVRLLTLIAVFILVLACINFMNLSTAKSSGRMKEVGMKKVMGVRRRSLIIQYLGESVGMAFLSLLFAIGWVLLLLPQFNQITGKQLGFPVSAGFILPVLAITFLTGLMAGLYPAFYLSGFKPIFVLKGILRTSWSELFIRKGLVIFQYTLSLVFMVAVMVIYKQMQFVQTINLGYNKDHVISFIRDGQLDKQFRPFITDLKKIPGVTGVSSLQGNLTGNSSGSTEKIDWEGKQAGQKLLFTDFDVDYDLLDVLGITMATGRNFSTAFATDSLAIIINQAAVDAMALKNPLGKTISVWGGVYHIIGVTRNFHFESLYQPVKPCFIRCNLDGRNIVVRLKAGQERHALSSLSSLYHRYAPEFPLEFKFLDEEYQAMYVSEQRVALLSRYFTVLAVIISCLGLFGMAAFAAQKRRKEIGIRKVIGASAGNIVVMLSEDFLKLLLIAMLMAFPLAWWAMHDWLQEFAYRARLGGIIFVIAGLAVLLITMITISLQSVRAALLNPVSSLRSE